VIALSANALTLDIARALQAGFVDYVTKPIDVEKFLQAVDRGLDLSEHQPDRGSGVR
jgi:CheY-like chemotaxis protein